MTKSNLLSQIPDHVATRYDKYLLRINLRTCLWTAGFRQKIYKKHELLYQSWYMCITRNKHQSAESLILDFKDVINNSCLFKNTPARN